jgi:phage tail-like protein
MAEQALVPGGAMSMQLLDSLCANEFAFEIEGERIPGIFRVSGLTSFKLDVKTTNSMRMIQEPFKIVKMVQRDANAPFNRWLRETVDKKDDIVRPKRTLAVVAIDDGIETRRWTVKGAWITSVSYSDFNSASSEMVEEAVTIQFERIEETWPATPNLT